MDKNNNLIRNNRSLTTSYVKGSQESLNSSGYQAKRNRPINSHHQRYNSKRWKEGIILDTGGSPQTVPNCRDRSRSLTSDAGARMESTIGPGAWSAATPQKTQRSNMENALAQSVRLTQQPQTPLAASAPNRRQTISNPSNGNSPPQYYPPQSRVSRPSSRTSTYSDSSYCSNMSVDSIGSPKTRPSRDYSSATHQAQQTPNSHNGASSSWRGKIIGTIKNSIMGTPRFHRRGVNYSSGGDRGYRRDSNVSDGYDQVDYTMAGGAATPSHAKTPSQASSGNCTPTRGHGAPKQRSWFNQLVSGLTNTINQNSGYSSKDSGTHEPLSSGVYSTPGYAPSAYVTTPRTEVPSAKASQSNATVDTVTVMFDDRSHSAIKASIIQSLLSIHQITHSMTAPDFFTCEYRSSLQGTVVFTKTVKFTIEIYTEANHLHSSPTEAAAPKTSNVYVCFRMISGNSRRFRKIVQVLYAHISSPNNIQAVQKGTRTPTSKFTRPSKLPPPHLTQTTPRREPNPHAAQGANNASYAYVGPMPPVINTTPSKVASNQGQSRTATQSYGIPSKVKPIGISTPRKQSASHAGASHRVTSTGSNIYNQISEFSKEMEQLNQSAANLQVHELVKKS